MRFLDIATGVFATVIVAVPLQAPASVIGQPGTGLTQISAHGQPSRRLSVVAGTSGEDGRPKPAARVRTVREVSVIAERFEFQPSRIEVEQGDHVKITVRSADGTHGFEIRRFGIHAKVPRDGEPITVEFDADRAGTFEIKCFEYCGMGHRRMKATLVVNPARPGE